MLVMDRKEEKMIDIEKSVNDFIVTFYFLIDNINIRSVKELLLLLWSYF